MSKKRFLQVILSFFILALPIHSDSLVVCTGMNCSVYLPDNWVATESGDSLIQMYDTTYAFEATLGVMRYDRNTADFPVPEDWTRANYIAYLLSVRYGFDPWGALLYMDSSQTSTQDAHWAPEAYAQLFSLDTTIGSWAEYIRYTSIDDYGYELYAVGDTTDMYNNIGTYAAILQTIDFEGATISRNQSRPSFPLTPNSGSGQIPRMFTPTGRLMNSQVQAERLDAIQPCIRNGRTTLSGLEARLR